ncbi:class I mannose-6-phosphate isomerase [bacterium]|nr:class I mannose-6-phosphate isomerase [bacterium]
MKPFRLKSLPVVRVWGGTRLAPGATQPVGERWEVYGELQLEGSTETLDQLCVRLGRGLLGDWAPDPNLGFPLLIKWLDCQDWLSIQVHPDDSVAPAGLRGKAEAWYFAQVDAQAEVIHGWKSSQPSRSELQALTPRDWLNYLKRYRPEAGSWSYTSPGTVHALGPGLLVYEVQQSSDLTYRLYDWDRLGLDGQPREMHVEQGIAAICDSLPEPVVAPPEDLLGKLEVICPHFLVESVSGERSWSTTGKSFEIITALAPTHVDDHLLEEGASILVPADAGPVRCSSAGSWLRVRLAPGQKE